MATQAGSLCHGETQAGSLCHGGHRLEAKATGNVVNSPWEGRG
jgi:hypothetical protein